MQKVLLLLTIAVLLSSVAVAAPPKAQVQQYTVRLKVMRGPESDQQKHKVLAEPTVAVMGGREANVHVGGQVGVLDEQVDYGTQMKLRVNSLGDAWVSLRATIELAEVVKSPKEIAVTAGQVFNLGGAIKLKKPTTVFLSGKKEMGTWLSITVEPFELQVPK